MGRKNIVKAGQRLSNSVEYLNEQLTLPLGISMPVSTSWEHLSQGNHSTQ
jgi:hypothetical protein